MTLTWKQARIAARAKPKPKVAPWPDHARDEYPTRKHWQNAKRHDRGAYPRPKR